MKILIIFLAAILFTACTIEIDGPDGVSNEEYNPEIPANPETEIEWLCFIPFEKGREWTYNVTYHQPINIENEHYIHYCGTETWTCTKVNWQDSIFVLGCSFNGERKIVNNDEGKTENVSTQSGWVQVQILNKKICLLQEGGDTLYPFAGELFLGLKNRFQVVFPNAIDDFQTVKNSGGTLLFEFLLDKKFGIMQAGWEDQSAQTSLIFSIIQ